MVEESTIPHKGRHGQAPGRLEKDETVVGFVVIDTDQVTTRAQIGRDEARERLHEHALDGALQVAGSVAGIGAGGKQVARRGIRRVENEAALGVGEEHAVLHLAQFDVQDLLVLGGVVDYLQGIYGIDTSKVNPGELKPGERIEIRGSWHLPNRWHGATFGSPAKPLPLLNQQSAREWSAKCTIRSHETARRT